MSAFNPVVRQYQSADERGWLLCRLLSFFDTCYYDDVHTSRTVLASPSIQLVADLDGQVVGLLDVAIEGTAATIDCIAVHPDHQRAGVGSTLLAAALRELPSSVGSIDAWTREDPAALTWYRRQGFQEQFRYLHVYKSGDEDGSGFEAPAPLSTPLLVFSHARIEHEPEVRSRFDRVYVCTQFLHQTSH